MSRASTAELAEHQGDGSTEPPQSSPRGKTDSSLYAYHDKGALSRSGRHILVIGACLIAVLPLVVMVITSLHPANSFTSASLELPAAPTLENYRIAWTDLGFNRMLVNSAIFSVSTAVMTTAIAAMASFALIRFRFAGSRPFLIGMVTLMAMPPVAIIIPVYVLFSSAGLVDRHISAILVETGLLLPFAIFLLYSGMRSMPREPFESAQVDGAGAIRQFWSIAIPMSRGYLATNALVVAVIAWNELLTPLVFWQSDRLQTLMTGIASLGPGKTGLLPIPLLMAGVAISVIPLVLVFGYARRALVSGLTEGAVK